MNFYEKKSHGRRVYRLWGHRGRLTNAHLRELAHRSKSRAQWMTSDIQFAAVMMADELLRLRRDVRRLRAGSEE
jgi:hypothetical protein